MCSPGPYTTPSRPYTSYPESPSLHWFAWYLSSQEIVYALLSLSDGHWLAICGDKGYEAFDFAGWDVHTLVYEIPGGSGQMLAWEEKRIVQGLESGSAHTAMF